MLRLRHQDRAEARSLRWIFLGIDLQLVHPLQIEEDATLGAVDLEELAGLAPWDERGRFKGPYGPVLEPGKKRRRFVDRHLTHLRALGVRTLKWTFLDEGLGDAYDFGYGAKQEVREVHEVGAQVGKGSRCPRLFPQPPRQGR